MAAVIVMRAPPMTKAVLVKVQLFLLYETGAPTCDPSFKGTDCAACAIHLVDNEVRAFHLRCDYRFRTFFAWVRMSWG